jgi:hypothetical protein
MKTDTQTIAIRLILAIAQAEEEHEQRQSVTDHPLFELVGNVAHDRGDLAHPTGFDFVLHCEDQK